jgi:Ca2+-binding RTX toxin-like protein
MADTIPPYILSYSSGVNVAVNANLSMTFSESVQVGAGLMTLRSGSTILYSGNAGGNPAISVSGSTVTFDPPQQLAYATSYTLEFSPGTIRDLSGNAATYASLSFKTELSPVAVNLTGTDQSDTLEGSNLGDTLAGGAGNDTLYGNGGDDTIRGGDEFGSYTGDYLAGGSGNDTLDAGAGNDTVYGGEGNDILSGGTGNDTLSGDDGNDQVDGGEGDDYLSDGYGIDTLRGGAGNDTLAANGAGGLLDGGEGDDRITSNNLYNIAGGAGNDTITISTMSIYYSSPTPLVTTADGGDGDDVFRLFSSGSTSATATTTLSGGAGSDTYAPQPYAWTSSNATSYVISDFTLGAGGDKIDLHAALSTYYTGNPFADGRAKLVADGADTLLQAKWSVTDTTYATLLRLAGVQPSQLSADNFVGGFDPGGSSRGLTLSAAAGGGTLTGDMMDDTLTGNAGNDILSGDAGNDTLDGAGGADRLDGGSGNDLLKGNDGADILNGGYGNDTLDGGAGDDVLTDYSDDNVLDGGSGNDNISANSYGTSTVDGGEGNDTISGGEGSGTFAGGNGNDYIIIASTGTALHQLSVDGGAGDDRISMKASGNGATFTASGGGGADIFAFGTVALGNQIIVTDFSAADGDKIDLTALLKTDYEGNPFGPLGYLKLEQSGADVKLYADADGAAGQSSAATLVATFRNIDLATLTAASFVGGFDPSGSTKGLDIAGTDVGDVLEGTAQDDTIRGGGGADHIYGGAGSDRIDGDDDTATGMGAAAGDYLDGGNGADILHGGAGSDTLYGGAGNDTLDGGADDDYLNGEAGADQLSGGDGNDTLWDDGGGNVLSGGAGNDRLYVTDYYGLANSGSGSVLDGGAGNDTLSGGGGNDTLNGGAGNDAITVSLPYSYAGAPVSVTVDGGDGDDDIVISGGSNTGATVSVSGGAGSDTFHFNSFTTSHAAITIKDFAAGAGGDKLDVLSLAYTASGNPFGAAQYVRLVQSGADTLLQLDSDGITGSAGFQTVAVLQGVDASTLTSLNFTEGTHPDGSLAGMRLDGSDAGDNLVGGRFADLLQGGAGDDTLDGGAGDDTLAGGAGNDVLSDTDGTNVLNGDAGDDILYSWGNGANTLDGGDGNDILQISGSAKVEARGGAGSDTYYLANSGNVTITDFQVGEGGDILNAYSTAPGSGNPFASGLLRLVQRGADTVLQRTVTSSDGASTYADVVTLKNVDMTTLGSANFAYGFNPDGSDHGRTVAGTDADDEITGGWLDDTLHGGPGNDRLAGSYGDDLVDGGAGNDVLSGGPGDDLVSGGDGDDRLFSYGLGHDSLDGGAGNDVLTLTVTAVYPTPGPGTTPFAVQAGGGSGKDQFLVTVERGLNAQLTLTGGADADTFNILTLAPDARIAIADFQAGPGGDLLNLSELGPGTYAARFEAGDYRIVQRGADAVVQVDVDGAGGADDYIDVVTLQNLNADSLTGDNLLRYSVNAVTQAGRDYTGTDGDDTIVGSLLDDTLSGGAGNDRLAGGLGNDVFKLQPNVKPGYTMVASGGAGQDVFEAGTYQVTDFSAGSGGDLIGLAGLGLSDTGTAFSGGYLRLVQNGKDTLLQLDKDGAANSGAHFETLLTLKNVDAAKLTADNIVEHVDPHAAAAAVPGKSAAGGSSSDSIAGSAGDDHIEAGAGNDVLSGGAGNDVLDGGSGIDTARYSGSSADYVISREADGVHLIDLRGIDGSDALSGVERLVFSDTSLALDVDGAAGQAYRLYLAAFDRTPDLAGLGYWIAALDGGATVHGIAGGFAQSAEFAALYGGVSNQEIVTRLYQNVLHRTPDQAGYDYWLNVLDKQLDSLQNVLANFSESAENQGTTAAVIGDSVAYQAWGG